MTVGIFLLSVMQPFEVHNIIFIQVMPAMRQHFFLAANLIMSNCVFHENGNGGAIHSFSPHVVIQSCIFEDNEVDYGDGGLLNFWKTRRMVSSIRAFSKTTEQSKRGPRAEKEERCVYIKLAMSLSPTQHFYKIEQEQCPATVGSERPFLSSNLTRLKS